MPDEIEIRRIPEDDIRANAELGTFDGYASAFRYVDSYATAFMPGAFRKTINDHKLKDGGSRIPAVFFHEPTQMVGPVTALGEDQRGLAFSARAIDDGATGSMVLAHLRGGTPMGMSFMFRRIKDRVATDKDGIDLTTAPEGVTLADVRAITEVALQEITVLPWTFASQPKAEVVNIRATATITSLLDAVRSGSVTTEQRNLLDQLVEEWTRDAAAGNDHRTPGDDETRNYDAEYELLIMELGVAA